MGALTRQAEIAGTLIAVWPHGDRRLEYFQLQSNAFSELSGCLVFIHHVFSLTSLSSL